MYVRHRGKTIILMILCFMLYGASSSASATEGYNATKMHEVIFPDQKPFIDENNRTLVPLRFVAEQLGADVSWDATKNQVTIACKGDLVFLTPGSDQAIRITNGQSLVYTMGAKVVLNQERVMVPLRFLSETMGSHVVWEERINAVIVNNCMVINLSDTPLNLASLTQQAETGITIKNFYFLQDVYFANDKIMAYVNLHNNDPWEKTLWLQFNLHDSMKKSYSVHPQEISLKPGQDRQIPLTWIIPDDILTGYYLAALRVWDRSPENGAAVLLANAEIQEGVRLYKSQENFLEFDKVKWRKSSHMLEGTSLKTQNVCLGDGKLLIHLPEGVFEGGEIQSCHPMGFGSYEIRMKIPDVPSSITGFFLYKYPVCHNEIDIEIYNQPNGDYFLTTYAEGEKKNLFIDRLPFNPTAGFHNYRIDYYPNQLSFYADDVLLKEWSEGLTNESMYIVVNAWYPDWLARVPAKHGNAYLEIDWIRY